MSPDARLVAHRHRLPRHGRHRPRPAFRQPVLAGGLAAHMGRRHEVWTCRPPARLCSRCSTRGAAHSTGIASITGARNSASIFQRSNTALREQIRYLDGAPEFLDALRGLGKRVLLTTNAHPISLRDQGCSRRASARISTSWCRRTSSACRRNRRSSGRDSPPGMVLTCNARCSWTIAPPCCTRRCRRASVGSTRCCSRIRRAPPHAPVDGIPGVRRLADLPLRGADARAATSGLGRRA